MPRIVRLKNHISRKLRLKVPMSRRNIVVRDDSQCQYCGVLLHPDEYQIEHVVPRAQGGISEWRNLVLACCSCNNQKRDRTPEEAGLKLRRKPYAPTQFDPRFNFKLHIKVLRPEWKDYKSYLYWNVSLDK